MRSIFSKVLLWFVGTIAISLAGLGATSMVVSARLPEHFDFMSKTQQLQLDGAIQAYEEGGPDKLKNYLGRIDQLYFAQHLLVDSKGTSLVDGSDRSDLLARASRVRFPRPPRNGRIVFSRASADGRYRLLILVPPPVGPWFFFPYFLWIVVVVVALGYWLAMHMARPLKGLRQAVERFGHGDLTVRFGSDRRDEIGQLAAAFNQMAGRIETLLTAERRLLQDVSHELRSPLTRLGFALELARTAPDREAALARARKESGRLADLVDELLQLTRAEGDPSARIREDVALGDLLHELAADGSVEAEAKRCEIIVRADQAVVVPGDRELLRRAVENVVRNAIRHAPEQTPIEIDLEPSTASSRGSRSATTAPASRTRCSRKSSGRSSGSRTTATAPAAESAWAWPSPGVPSSCTRERSTRGMRAPAWRSRSRSPGPGPGLRMPKQRAIRLVRCWPGRTHPCRLWDNRRTSFRILVPWAGVPA